MDPARHAASVGCRASRGFGHRPDHYLEATGIQYERHADCPDSDHTDHSRGTFRRLPGRKPEGNGDDAWVGHDNRVYVRVRNIGPGMASNVRVQVFQNSPPGMGDAGPDWSYIGTIMFATLNPGDVAADYVLWRPPVGEHTCIKAVIDDIPDELSTTNNAAQENVTAFDTSEGSPFRPVDVAMTVYNPFADRRLPVHMHVRDIPRGWLVSVEPREILLAAGGREQVKVRVHPSGPLDVKLPPALQEQMRQYRPGYIGKPKVEALAPYADTFIPLGGVEVWTHLTLVPPVAGTQVAVEMTSDGERVLEFAKTEGRGFYMFRTPTKAAGVWKVQAFFAGDSTREAVESPVRQFRVIPAN